MTVCKCREVFEHVQKRAACHLLMKSAQHSTKTLTESCWLDNAPSSSAGRHRFGFHTQSLPV